MSMQKQKKVPHHIWNQQTPSPSSWKNVQTLAENNTHVKTYSFYLSLRWESLNCSLKLDGAFYCRKGGIIIYDRGWGVLYEKAPGGGGGRNIVMITAYEVYRLWLPYILIKNNNNTVWRKAPATLGLVHINVWERTRKWVSTKLIVFLGPCCCNKK